MRIAADGVIPRRLEASVVNAVVLRASADVASCASS